ncbi:D-ribose pyranase [Aerococcaceae bacterium WS4759]|uniref:D-ribose pyranase n=1 Tax=Fundicoccus ignavus TaxID=2664442 RepID=A0A6I2GR50_9LACT|nr:D-ribose pyranase [Fundicoccus ignavus]MRI85935.1 D-ribose pyranase [Fundicoccus ignavus]
MKLNGILNSNISKVLSDLGHTDQLTIGDCGLPVPPTVNKIDLALKLGTPSFIEVLEAVLADMKVEKIILAEEIQEQNPAVLSELKTLLKDVEIVYVPHTDFKHATEQSKAVIRTGETTPYANVILQSAVIF